MISDIKFGALTGSTSTTVTAPGTNAQATTLAGTPVEKSLSFIYGPEHQRIKQVAVGGPNPGTTWYLNGEDSLGLTYEKELKSTGITEHKHYLQAGGITFAMHTMRVKTAGGTIAAPALPTGTAAYSSSYLHHDQLGSIIAITSSAGVVVERLAYDPWGKRRFASGTNTGAADTLDAITGQTIDRGFTMHEHIDEMGIINMNGRIYDPLIGRFMSADPYIQAPSDLQSFNRYAYVRNNPLNLTDPSGYKWWVKFREKFLKPAIAKFIDMYCYGCATLALNAWNAYWTKDANGHRLGWKAVAFSVGLTLIGGTSDNAIFQAGVNMLSGCGMSAMAGGSCKKGAVDALTNEISGPIVGGCLNARRAGGSCAVGAREAGTSMAGDYLAGRAADKAHDYLNSRTNSGGAGSGGGSGGGGTPDIETLVDQHIQQLEVSNTVQLACYPCEGGGWGIPDTLSDHFGRHGSDFGAKSEAEYVSKTQAFYRDTLLNPNSEIRMHNNSIYMYDRVTNTFGVYNLDGTTQTMYKPPEGKAYWDRLAANGNLGKVRPKVNMPKLTPSGQTLRLLRLFGSLQE